MMNILPKGLRICVTKTTRNSVIEHIFRINLVRYRLYNVCLTRISLQDDEHRNMLRTNGSEFTRSIFISTKLLEAIKVKAPVFPDSVADGDLRWKKKAGDPVSADEIIAEIETDKVALPVQAPSAGVIKELLVQEGAQVKSEAVVCTIVAK